MNRMMLVTCMLIGCVAIPETDDDVFIARWPAGERATGERVRCVVVELANDRPIAVRAMRAELAGAEHVTVYRAPAGAPLSTAPAPCEPLADGTPLLVATRKQPELVLPDGIAFAFEPRQRLRIELDDTATGAVQTMTLELEAAPGNAPDSREAVVEHVALPSVALRPNAVAVIDDYITMPAKLDGAGYFAFVGHTGRHGVGVRIAVATDASSDKIPVYLPIVFDWAAPPMSTIAPRTLPANGRFYVQCAYYNETVDDIGDELCGFWAYSSMSEAMR